MFFSVCVGGKKLGAQASKYLICNHIRGVSFQIKNHHQTKNAVKDGEKCESYPS